MVESALGLLRRAGLGQRDSVHVLRPYIAFLVGSVLREVGTTADTAEQPAEAAGELSLCDTEYEIDFGLTLLLDAVHAHLTPKITTSMRK
jgi:hypothetical protein